MNVGLTHIIAFDTEVYHFNNPQAMQYRMEKWLRNDLAKANRNRKVSVTFDIIIFFDNFNLKYLKFKECAVDYCHGSSSVVLFGEKQR